MNLKTFARAALLVLAGCVLFIPLKHPTRLPSIHDVSGASPEHVEKLVRRALEGMGFDGSDPRGPNPGDRVFIGRRYIAWIDETGFYGKLNGLWLLHGEGDTLDFVMVENGRPVNSLIVGEHGDGHFPTGYQGAEALEFPNRTVEAGDDAKCAKSDWCNQYGLNEANPIDNPRIPWWQACNVGRASFGEKHEPIITENHPDGGLRLVYEGRLTKEADGDGVMDGDSCHADYLFPDGVRRTVDIRVGLQLYPREDYVDRTIQIVNRTGNPPFEGSMSVIGGFVLTAWPKVHPLKRWTSHELAPKTGSDSVIGWLGKPMTFTTPEGRYASIANVGPSDNDDVGACFCEAHGGLEMGGGLIHAGVSLPLGSGQASIVARRRLTLR